MVRSVFLRMMLVVVLICMSVLSACTTKPAPVEPTSFQETPDTWWNQSVFYQIFVRSFYDSNGDGVGDFQGIIQKLDYLNDGDPSTTSDLGIQGIWLLPIHPSPSYHGYDVTDYYAVNPAYGTMDDFKQLLDEAHKRGIRIIMDLVINHTSEDHPWFQQALDPKSPYRDWYIWSKEKPQYLGPWSQVVWHMSPTGGYYYGVFWSGMPDLNYQNPKVGEEMEKIAGFWLKDVGVDGFRVDGARHLIEDGEIQANSDATHAWFKDFYQYVKGINPDAMIIGEVWDSVFAAVKYVKEDEFDLVFDFETASAILKGVGSGEARKITDAINFNYGTYPLGRTAPFLTNHDMDRIMSQLGRDEDKARVAASVMLTLPGVPFIYYGEEIGMIGTKPDEYIRTPMQWSGGKNAGFSIGLPWIGIKDDYPEKNVEQLSVMEDSLFTHYRRLVQVRNQSRVLQMGNILVVNTNDPNVYAVLRTWQGQLAFIVVNLGDEKVENLVLNRMDGISDGQYTLVPIFGEARSLSFSVSGDSGFSDLELGEIAPYQTIILAGE